MMGPPPNSPGDEAIVPGHDTEGVSFDAEAE